MLVDSLLSWSRRNSLCPLFFGACCTARDGIWGLDPRLDPLGYPASPEYIPPRHADLLIVAGRISLKLAPLLRQAYDEMLSPRWVVALGACASTGGAFDTYAGVGGVGAVIPVDVHIAGCPPDPGDLSEGLSLLQKSMVSGRRDQVGI